MRFIVFDNIEGEGVDLSFDFENGMAINIFLDDNSASELIQLIQNKINARC